jgi:diacylglycerol kinase (ATP)
MVRRRRRQQRTKRKHFALLVNRKAAGYQKRLVDRFVATVRKKGDSYTVYEPDSAIDLLKQAEVAVGLRRANSTLPAPFERGGPVTALVACGGDGTFNLVARAALRAGVPVGLIPMGRFNNFALSLCGSIDTTLAMKKILEGGLRKIDSATAANVTFFGSAGLGFVPGLIDELDGRAVPRLALGWSQVAARAAASVHLEPIVLKVDAFRFDFSPIILNVNLLPYSGGLPLTPVSIFDDGRAEVIFDQASNAGNLGGYVRLICKGRYLYGDEVRLYRGQAVSIQQVRGRTLYLDGELTEIPTQTLDIHVGPEQLQVLC